MSVTPPPASSARARDVWAERVTAPQPRLVLVAALVGLLAGLAFGLTPWEVYGHSALTVISAVVGLGLTAAGWLVCRWLLARAVAPRDER